ncbi:MAG: hypothetical protein ACO294_01415 [Methylococcales bacterium]
MNSKLLKIIHFILLLLPILAFAAEPSSSNTTNSLPLTHHIVGYLAIAVTVLAYIAAMAEDVIALQKSGSM